MNRFCVKCPSCHYPLPAENYNSSAKHTVCSGCDNKVLVYALPALYRRSEIVTTATEAGLDDAVCFYHTAKKAEHVCDCCGRFLCGLCALPMGEETLCASCLESQRKDPKGRQDLKPRQFRHDKLALGLSVWPLIIYFPVTVFTAPAALFVALRYWKLEVEFARGWISRMGIAAVFSFLEIAGWLLLLVYLIGEWTHG